MLCPEGVAIKGRLLREVYMATTTPGGSRLPAPVPRDGSWAVLGGTANRLWERGCFGYPIRDGILLTSAEVLNAHRLRGLPLPHDKWLAEALKNHPELLFECEVLDALRFPGEKVVLAQNLNAANAVLLDPRSWALRWPRNVKPKEADPLAEIRWFRSSDEIDWEGLAEWTLNVETGGRIPELLIVDQEHGVVTYRCRLHNPSGPLNDPFRGLNNDERRTISHAWIEAKETEGGYWMDIPREKWPVSGVGINLEGGVWVSELESRIISRIVNPTMPQPTGESGNHMGILSDLLSRGLAIRSGFKYGTRWRVYAGLVGGEHAPWLVVPLNEAPTDWGEACLAARLAAGVNKHWMCAMTSIGNGEWRYLALERPPSDSRWTNPVRH
jgi:hypothetical protein